MDNKTSCDTVAILSDLVGLVQQGKPLPKDSLSGVLESLHSHQAKLDLVQVGVTLHEMNRLPQLASHIGTIEGVLFADLGDGVSRVHLMEPRDQISLLKTVHAEYRNTIGYTSARAIRPQISSTETMRQVPEVGTTETEAPRLPAASRTAVREYLEQLGRRLPQPVVEAEVVTPVKRTRKSRAKPKSH